MDERLAKIFRAGLNCAYNANAITEDEYFDGLGYVAEHEATE